MGRQSFLKFFSETFVSNSYYFDQLNFLYHILKINITLTVGCYDYVKNIGFVQPCSEYLLFASWGKELISLRAKKKHLQS